MSRIEVDEGDKQVCVDGLVWDTRSPWEEPQEGGGHCLWGGGEQEGSPQGEL